MGSTSHGTEICTVTVLDGKLIVTQVLRNEYMAFMSDTNLHKFKYVMNNLLIEFFSISQKENIISCLRKNRTVAFSSLENKVAIKL